MQLARLAGGPSEGCRQIDGMLVNNQRPASCSLPLTCCCCVFFEKHLTTNSDLTLKINSIAGSLLLFPLLACITAHLLIMYAKNRRWLNNHHHQHRRRRHDSPIIIIIIIIKNATCCRIYSMCHAKLNRHHQGQLQTHTLTLNA